MLMSIFNDAETEHIKKHLKVMRFSRGDVIFKEGSIADSLYIIDRGSAKCVHRKAFDGGDDDVVKVIKSGHFAGEESLLSDAANYFTTAVALEDTTALVLEKGSIPALMMTSISTATKLLLELSKNYRVALISEEMDAKILSFYGPGGGAGNTTLAVNTAMALKRETPSRRVAFLDVDLQFGNSYIFMKAVNNPNISRMVQLAENLVYDRIKEFMITVGGVDFLFGPMLPQESEYISRSILVNVILQLQKRYDYIIIDTGSYLNEHILHVWDVSDEMIITATPDLTSLDRFRRLFHLFKSLNYPATKINVILNRMGLDQDFFIKHLEELTLAKVFSVADDPEHTQEALTKGEPVVLRSPKSPFADDMNKFVAHLLGHRHSKEDTRSGFIGKIRNYLFG